SVKYFHQKKSRDVKNSQALFGIVQGVIYDDLRKESAKVISELGFDGVAIGGLSVGESRDEMHHMLEIIEPILLKDKPRYLMGVGEPIDLLNAVERGIDMFDCVLPTRIARNGAVFTAFGRLNLNNKSFITDSEPIEKDCGCYTCQNFSRAYISHLIREKEVLGIRLTTIHNLHFVLNLMKNIRASIKENKFMEFKKGFISNYSK
ncbi:tRNA guanosine(34) transglycosylase Tgt, partial [bacterium (Candidatus Howlettbacteria) CG_4_10_14_0_8_um_filter_40_9]